MKDQAHQRGGYYDEEDCNVDDFAALINQTALPASMPQADEITQNVPVYDMARLRPALDHADTRRALMAEWAFVLKDGPGVLALKSAYAATEVLDAATRVFTDLIDEEKQGKGGGADHFAAAGTNDRIWNAHQKLCLRAPDIFLRYVANTAIDAVAEAWLGPHYQMTAQVNLVHPGGAAQQAHRDYHLGFQTAEISARYPAHVHDLSASLTLQGAIAHCDMPIESGPTKLLPFSQLYRPGYAAWRRADFRQCFEENYIQLPLEKGDAVFFNPALFHSAGANTSADIQRMANLLQVSSAFGRAMETLDRRAMSKALYPHLKAETGLSDPERHAAIAACAEGYSFPTNLDRDPPVGGLAPETQQALFHRALNVGMSADDFGAALDAIVARQSP